VVTVCTAWIYAENPNFDVLLTAHLSIILVLTNLMHKLVYNKFITCLYMFRALCAHHQEVKIVQVRINYRRILQNHIFTNTEQKYVTLLPFEKRMFAVS